ncbi:MAG TPA: OsmC family protein [Chitinophagaceae bacterium]|nr:OsmC family protein [Chitinophagaceae bacterium]HMZ46965.1 OsmC family protein [Chitinophagaceae bacterium]HNF29567.1 OsmC family protein [Chitinophagaceae bacterium]HNJ58596.1 OsmC family protein [Chitinophagaceae bacterium]HNL81813.1 OsmC family protein [Chitinophagaceae bacterium]
MSIITAERIAADFEMQMTDATGNTMKMDIPIEQGGNGKGLRPMQTMLAALCGCSTVDIVSILNKQKQTIETFKVFVDGEREKNKTMALWQTIHLVFEMSGNIEPDKAFRAVQLSLDKYCSVAETLRKAGASISFTVILNNEKLNYQPE